MNEWKKDRRRPIRTKKSIKNKTYLSAIKPSNKIKRRRGRKSSYFEELEIKLQNALLENREMKNWRDTPGNIMPAEEAVSPVTYSARREGDEYVVIVNRNGKKEISRIPTDEVDSADEAIALIKKYESGITERKKIKESIARRDQISSRLFEQDLTYFDKLNRELIKRVKK